MQPVPPVTMTLSGSGELQLIEVRDAALAHGLERGKGVDGSRERQRMCRVVLAFQRRQGADVCRLFDGWHMPEVPLGREP